MKPTLLIILTALALAACNAQPPAPPTTATPAGPAPTSVNTPQVVINPASTITPEVEILRTSGNGAYTGEPFRINTDTAIVVHYRTMSDERISISLMGINPSDPAYSNLSYAISYHPLIGKTDGFLIAGEYQLVIETENGVWEVWIEKAK